MRLIDADATKYRIKNYMSVFDKKDKREICEMLNDAPTIEAEPIRHGRWISESQQRVFKCSVCGHYLDFDGVNAGRGSAYFCPNCGAHMDEEVNENETYLRRCSNEADTL